MRNPRDITTECAIAFPVQKEKYYGCLFRWLFQQSVRPSAGFGGAGEWVVQTGSFEAPGNKGRFLAKKKIE